MAIYEFRFLKEVFNDVGHGRAVVQRVLSVEADSEGRARQQACELFCVHERVPDWRDHADRIEVARLEIARSLRASQEVP